MYKSMLVHVLTLSMMLPFGSAISADSSRYHNDGSSPIYPSIDAKPDYVGPGLALTAFVVGVLSLLAPRYDRAEENKRQEQRKKSFERDVKNNYEKLYALSESDTVADELVKKAGLKTDNYPVKRYVDYLISQRQDLAWHEGHFGSDQAYAQKIKKYSAAIDKLIEIARQTPQYQEEHAQMAAIGLDKRTIY